MKKVLVLSYNSVIKDARIIKEADSLVSNGYKVTILGFKDNNTPEDYSPVTECGAEIELIKPDLTRGLIGRIYHNHRKWISDFLRLVEKNKQNFVFLAFAIFLLLSLSNKNLLTSPVLWFFVIAVSLCTVFLLKKKKIITNLISKLITRALVPIRRRFWDNYKKDSMVSKALDYDFDILHVHDLHPMSAALEIKKFKSCKLIWDAHEIYDEVAQITEKQKKDATNKIKKFQNEVDFFITINPSIASYYEKKYPLLPEALIIKNATKKAGLIDYDGRLHIAADLPLEQKIILYQGGFAEKRGLREIVKSSQFLDSSFTLVMMGWGRLEAELKEIADDININSEREIPPVVFIPPAAQKDLAYWTAGAYVGLIPYEHFGLNHLYCTPNKLWEYPNAGVPILCTSMVEMKKTVEHWNIGWLIEDLSLETISRVINSITTSDMIEKKENCSSYIESDNWSVYEAKLIRAYSEIFS